MALVATGVVFTALAAPPSRVSSGLDHVVLRVGEAVSGSPLEPLLTTAFFLSLYAATALAIVGLAVFVTRRQWTEVVFLLGGIGGVVILDLILKPLFERPALGENGGYSFPSGNAMGMMAALLSAALLASGPGSGRRVAIGIGALLLAVNSSAIVLLRWHYTSDVIGGWWIAAAWLWSLWLVVGSIERYRLRPSNREARAPVTSTSAPGTHPRGWGTTR